MAASAVSPLDAINAQITALKAQIEKKKDEFYAGGNPNTLAQINTLHAQLGNLLDQQARLSKQANKLPQPLEEKKTKKNPRTLPPPQ